MVSRASHYQSKARHSQREFGAEKPKPVARDMDTAWIPKAVQAMQELTVGEYWSEAEFTNNFEGLTGERLRELSRRGILHMRAKRDADLKFIRFEWALQECARLG